MVLFSRCRVLVAVHGQARAHSCVARRGTRHHTHAPHGAGRQGEADAHGQTLVVLRVPWTCTHRILRCDCSGAVVVPHTRSDGSPDSARRLLGARALVCRR
eukprot:5392230-Prymnesium_polylepis.1